MIHHKIIYSLMWWLLSFAACFPAENLPLDQQALLFPRGSRSLIPVAPFVGRRSEAASQAVFPNIKDGVDSYRADRRRKRASPKLSTATTEKSTRLPSPILTGLPFSIRAG